MMPVGVIADCLCVLLGGVLGAKFKERIPRRIKDPLVVIFGICAVAIGIYSFHPRSLPAVIIALLGGVVIGELIDLDKLVRRGFEKLLGRLDFRIDGDRDQYMKFYLIVAVTFCASGTNIFGALHEGISGDRTILFSKAAMDIFASVIFAAELGFAMLLIVIPQFLILTGVFCLSGLVMPLVNEAMMLDFVSVGGLLTFALGLCIAGIIRISAINFIPALVLALPVSKLFLMLGPAAQ